MTETCAKVSSHHHHHHHHLHTTDAAAAISFHLSYIKGKLFSLHSPDVTIFFTVTTFTLLLRSKHGLVLRGVLTLQLLDESIGEAAITSMLYPASHTARR